MKLYYIILLAALFAVTLSQQQLYEPYPNPFENQHKQYVNNEPQLNTLSTNSVSMTPATAVPSNNVLITVQLTAYQNPGHALAEPNRHCKCLQNCERFNTNIPQCRLFFITTVNSAHGSAESFESRYYTINNNTGDIEISQKNDFRIQQQFRVRNRPKVIRIFVYHIGKILDSAGTTIREEDVAVAGIFVVNVPDVSPLTSRSIMVKESITGQSTLSLTYSVQCTGNLIGPDCDLSCNKSIAGTVICQSNNTHFFSVCQSDAQNQISNCQPCPYGLKDNLHCRSADGGVLEPVGAQVVSTSFRTATIVLGCIAGLLLLLLLIVIIYSCIVVNKKRQEDEEAPGHNYHSSLRAEGNANRPLLQASYTAQSPSMQSDSFQRLPTAAPRNMPSLDAVPAKSSLRKTNYIPPAHLGGGSSINDTLNSSFASSVPMPPSREADV